MLGRLPSLNTLLRLIVIGGLLFRLTPVGSEIAEALMVMVADGDHSSDSSSPDPEHGCTTLVHHCGCHSVVGTIRDVDLVMLGTELERESIFVLSRPLLEPDARDLLRPPTV